MNDKQKVEYLTIKASSTLNGQLKRLCALETKGYDKSITDQVYKLSLTMLAHHHLFAEKLKKPYGFSQGVSKLDTHLDFKLLSLIQHQVPVVDLTYNVLTRLSDMYLGEGEYTPTFSDNVLEIMYTVFLDKLKDMPWLMDGFFKDIYIYFTIEELWKLFKDSDYDNKLISTICFLSLLNHLKDSGWIEVDLSSIGKYPFDYNLDNQILRDVGPQAAIEVFFKMLSNLYLANGLNISRVKSRVDSAVEDLQSWYDNLVIFTKNAPPRALVDFRQTLQQLSKVTAPLLEMINERLPDTNKSK